MGHLPADTAAEVALPQLHLAVLHHLWRASPLPAGCHRLQRAVRGPLLFLRLCNSHTAALSPRLRLHAVVHLLLLIDAPTCTWAASLWAGNTGGEGVSSGAVLEVTETSLCNSAPVSMISLDNVC